MVRPIGFGFDPLTANDNHFQKETELSQSVIQEKALKEHAGLVACLEESGISAVVLDPPRTDLPNAVFPNNWFSTDATGTVFIYPMFTESRRGERMPNLEQLLTSAGYSVQKTVDLTQLFDPELILEGTGSLVLDRTGRVAYCALSSRTNLAAASRWCELADYRLVSFHASDNGRSDGTPVYHTNVLMSIGTSFVVICEDSLFDAEERRTVLASLRASSRTIVNITLPQMFAFCGNVLELNGSKPCLLLSQTAFDAFTPQQRGELGQSVALRPVPIPLIEQLGGGSIRCCIAENFLPSNSGHL